MTRIPPPPPGLIGCPPPPKRGEGIGLKRPVAGGDPTAPSLVGIVFTCFVTGLASGLCLGILLAIVAGAL